MKKVLLLGFMVLSVNLLFAQSGDFGDEHEDAGFESENNTFEKMKIKNRSKKEYDDKIYKYIEGDYKAENNTIELANIEIDDNARNKDMKINVHVEDLQVEGDEYKDSLGIKRNRYKNFVGHDEREASYFDNEEGAFEQDEMAENSLHGNVRVYDKRREKVIDEDVTELETIDLRGNRDVKEVNVFIEDTRIIVDD
ncbi:MAG: Unknown protein [uncultured Sulfurovum sp.]|uniref:Organic solvent tolerance-like N-terminal domain-containing protein n=1 Tax=uncultured Sulfurovum sp. TaxID=269237 RepID=A0A6S6TB44_9BACT|nr:MAG: Unknown protein [uncultured Sulfurovum sp.]